MTLRLPLCRRRSNRNNLGCALNNCQLRMHLLGTVYPPKATTNGGWRRRRAPSPSPRTAAITARPAPQLAHDPKRGDGRRGLNAQHEATRMSSRLESAEMNELQSTLDSWAAILLLDYFLSSLSRVGKTDLLSHWQQGQFH